MATIAEQFANYDSPFLKQWRKEFREQGERAAKELRIRVIREKLLGLSLTADEADQLKTMIDCRVSQ